MTLAEVLKAGEAKSQTDIVLVALWWLTSHGGSKSATASDVQSALVRARVPGAKEWNLAARLAGARDKVDYDPSTSPRRWTLSRTGLTHLDGLVPTGFSPAHESEPELRRALASITDAEVRDYVEEGIHCLEQGALRATVLLIWAGAVAVLQRRMFAAGPVACDAAIRRHDSKCRPIHTADDLQYAKESTLLLAAQDLGLVDKGQRQMLEQSLDVRNKCGHPGKYQAGRKKVASVVEDLISIVFVPLA